MMRVLILMGSPRLHGNTAELCRPFIEELEAVTEALDTHHRHRLYHYERVYDQNAPDILQLHRRQERHRQEGQPRKDAEEGREAARDEGDAGLAGKLLLSRAERERERRNGKGQHLLVLQ